MKARRRHELQKNVLSAELVQAVDFLKKRSGAIAWAVLIAALIVFVVVYVRGRARQTAERLQTNFDRAMTDPTSTPEERENILKDLSAQDDSNLIAALATVALGDVYARRMAAAGPAQNPAEWKNLADKSAAYYRQAIGSFADQDLPVAKAHLGLAKLAESRRSFEAARAEYQAVLKITDLAGHPVARRAERGLKQLDALARPILMATTAPAQPATEPATSPASGPTTLPKM